ncbi:UDP-glycosyltransferase 73C3-like [Asparagus officinalis]|uniref:UDP-glycosyltransferase 73C3-like n=1 Tax=Asparagus officinalis TaxID=4686 RepID=UPI00098E2853|nr:UDP-glycosyltransferase 73C3-like [Asparagus officinalis]
MTRSEEAADGVVVNTFEELEPEYLESYERAIGKRVWSVGPLSLHDKDTDEHGAESNRPFVWVIKECERCPEVDAWMSSGFGERTRGRGLVITGWAPQVVVLSHPSVGGFITHCGWNSILEAISGGVPMITLPHFGDQFLNEKFVVEILKIGVSLGVKEPSPVTGKGIMRVTRDQIQSAVRSLMDAGKEGEERRAKARECGEMARKAMEEGGSSYGNVTRLIQFATGNAKR